MKKTKIVVPALAVLLLSTAASVSGTVAWFSMSTSVTVTGMQVTTKVSSNLLIAETNAEENYSDSIAQSRTGIIEPASSVDGATFFYTTNGLNDGDAKDDEYTEYGEADTLGNVAAGKEKKDSDFNSAYQCAGTLEDVAYAYIDYSFFLKGSAASDNQKISMTKCNIVYNNLPVTSSYAWRVGLFVADSEASTATPDSTAISGGVKTILGFQESKNQNQKNRLVTPDAETPLPGEPAQYYTDAACETPASGTADGSHSYYVKGDTAPKAVSAEDAAPTAVTNPNADAVVHAFSQKNTVKYFKVVVRLWLEGEDISCTSTTFADLTQSWKLDLEFKLGDGTGLTAPVNKIGSVAA